MIDLLYIRDEETHPDGTVIFEEGGFSDWEYKAGLSSRSPSTLAIDLLARTQYSVFIGDSSRQKQ